MPHMIREMNSSAHVQLHQAMFCLLEHDKNESKIFVAIDEEQILGLIPNHEE